MAMANDRVHPRKRKKVCSFCVDKVTHIDFKDTVKLRRYLSERGKILPRRTTGTFAAHLRYASAPADDGHQARPSDRPAALCSRLSFSSRSLSDADRLFGFAEVLCFPSRSSVWES